MSSCIARYMTRQPWTIRHDAPLAHAKAMMRDHGIRHLPVLADGHLVGVISERDVFRIEKLEHLGDGFTVRDAMRDDVYTADLDEPAEQVINAMAEHKYGSAIVVNDRYKVEGIFTTVDGLRLLADVLRPAAA